jgi:hypothetical protein
LECWRKEWKILLTSWLKQTTMNSQSILRTSVAVISVSWFEMPFINPFDDCSWLRSLKSCKITNGCPVKKAKTVRTRAGLTSRTNLS